MTESIDVLVQAALCAAVSSPDPGVPIAMPLVPFTPTGGAPYLEIRSVMRGKPLGYGMSLTGSVLRRGIFQVDAVAVDGGGEAPGLRLAALVASRFMQGFEILTGGFKLQFHSVPTIAAAVKDAPWVRFPVSIPYLVITG